MRVTLNAGMIIQNIGSSTHNVKVNYPDAQTAEVFLSHRNENPANRDFILTYNLRGNKIKSGLLLYEHENENFFAFQMEPTKNIALEEIPAREYLFVVDVSGSMNGNPLEVSKELMRHLLCDLRPTDTFNVQLFASSSMVFSGTPVETNEQNIEAAIRFLSEDQGGGERHPEIEVIATAQSVVEAAKVLRKTQPDILFLDIIPGDGTGFDVLEIFPDLKPKIIFVTASDEYALRAFKFAAIDYVLKPYSHEDLSLAIARAKEQIEPNKERLNILKDTLSAPEQRPDKISYTLNKIIIVDLDDIVRCESDSNNTIFHVQDNRKIFVTKTLKYFSDMLQHYDFLRIHQSHLINLQYISEYIKTDGGYLMLKNGEMYRFPFARKPRLLRF